MRVKWRWASHYIRLVTGPAHDFCFIAWPGRYVVWGQEISNQSLAIGFSEIV